MDLSLCMIVKNEAQNLSRCLESVQAVVDEMVILDTGSTDETVAIAQSFGAQVYEFPWRNDFAAARNEALRYVQGDWVLVLDADEVLVQAVVPALREAMKSDRHLVINLLRQEIGATQSPYSLVSRLFRHHPDLHFSRPYHAMVDDSVEALMRREAHWQVVEISDIAILHYGYEPGAIAQLNKFEKARTTMEGFLATHPGEPYVCSKLGALYVQMGQVQQGIDLLTLGLRASTVEAPVLFELHYHLGIGYTRLQQSILAEQHYQAAIQQPILPVLKVGAYNNWGGLLKERGDLTGARQAYEMVLELDPQFATGHCNLGVTLKALGHLPEAIAHYQTAIALNPSYADAYQNLGVAFLKQGKVLESLVSFKQAIALHEQQNPLEAQRLRQGLKQMGFQV